MALTTKEPKKGNLMAPQLAEFTKEERIRNQAAAKVSRKNSSLVRQWLENWFKEEIETEDASTALAEMFYGLVGFPYEEDEDGDTVRITESFRGSAAKYFEAPDAGFLVEDPENTTIELLRLKTDENGELIEAEAEESDDDDAATNFETETYDENIEVALREYALGFREDHAPRKGLTLPWLLQLVPGVGKGRAEDIIDTLNINKGNLQLRSLTQRQYYEALVASGAETAAEDDEIVEDENVEEPAEVDAADDLDEASEDFAEDAEDSVEEVEADEVEDDEESEPEDEDTEEVELEEEESEEVEADEE